MTYAVPALIVFVLTAGAFLFSNRAGAAGELYPNLVAMPAEDVQLEKSGFNYACTTVPGIMSAGDNMYELPRVGVSNMRLPVVIRNICKYI